MFRSRVSPDAYNKSDLEDNHIGQAQDRERRYLSGKPYSVEDIPSDLSIATKEKGKGVLETGS